MEEHREIVRRRPHDELPDRVIEEDDAPAARFDTHGDGARAARLERRALQEYAPSRGIHGRAHAHGRFARGSGRNALQRTAVLHQAHDGVPPRLLALALAGEVMLMDEEHGIRVALAHVVGRHRGLDVGVPMAHGGVARLDPRLKLEARRDDASREKESQDNGRGAQHRRFRFLAGYQQRGDDAESTHRENRTYGRSAVRPLARGPSRAAGSWGGFPAGI
jgi:hypothetical protein